MSYPEHKKLKAVQKRSQAIGEFLDWMSDQGYVRARYFSNVDHGCESGCEFDEVLLPSNKNVTELLAEFFVIDRDKLEEEKQAMLKEMREQNKKDQ